MRVIIKGTWAPYVGTDYCDALGTYDSLESPDALAAAADFAWDIWEPDDEDGFEDEGPDYHLEEYDPDKHDMQRSGGGSFLTDFERLK